MLRAGVGYCNDADPFYAGKTAAAAACSPALSPVLILFWPFAQGPLSPRPFLKGLQSVVGHNAPIIGGSTIGVITNDYLSYRGFPAAAAVLQSDTCRFRVASAGGLDRDEMSAGKLLAGLLPRSTTDRFLLAFYDSIRIPATITTPPVLNSSAPLLDGMEAGMTGGIPIVGAGLLGDYDFSATRQFVVTGLLSSMWSGVLHQGLSPSTMPLCTAVLPLTVSTIGSRAWRGLSSTSLTESRSFRLLMSSLEIRTGRQSIP